MSLLETYQPDSAMPWNRQRVGHLLSRMGFAATLEETSLALEQGPARTVDRALTGQPETPRYRELDALAETIAIGGNIEALRAWWVMRMIHTANPLAAKMSLFWHNHFATSNAKVNSPHLMLQQLQMFEKHALGRFGPMLVDVSKDPAMIIWLDTQVSRKGAANENYARELFELFSLGVGNYTEQDIRQAARAFTGWRTRDGRSFFTSQLHDAGRKTVFQKTGDFGLEDIIALVLSRKACPRFIAKKLFEAFAYPNHEEDVIDELAGVLRSSDYSIAETLRVLLRSKVFFSPRAYRAKIKSPVAFVVGTVRALQARVDGKLAADAMTRMGQKLFEPPSVKGWDGGRSWINSASMLVRMNVAAALTRGFAKDKGVDPAKLIERHHLGDMQAIQKFAVDLLFHADAPASLTARLSKACDDAQDSKSALRRCLYLSLVCPEYQLI